MPIKNGLPTAPVVEPRIPFAEIGRRGRELYESMQSEMERHYTGEYLVIDIETGEYAHADERRVAYEMLTKQRPDALVYCVRVGWKTTLRP